jgi:hypothetical protein
MRVAVLVLTAVLGVLLLRDIQRGDAPEPAAANDTPSASASPAPPASASVSRAVEDRSGVYPALPAPEQLQALPEVSVGAHLPDAPLDPAPSVDPGNEVLHPVIPAAVYTLPGGKAFARLPVTLYIAPTWVPIIERRPGWAMVLLPGAAHDDGPTQAGWIHLDPDIELGQVERRLRIDRTAHTAAVITDHGRVTTTDPSAPGGYRTFVAISATTRPRLWPLSVSWPLFVDNGHVCTILSRGIVIPGLPSLSPLGRLDDRGCLTTPTTLRAPLSDLPAAPWFSCADLKAT